MNPLFDDDMKSLAGCYLAMAVAVMGMFAGAVLLIAWAIKWVIS